MPNRLIRESSLTSETLDAISAEAERLFFRLTVVADDRGRFNADPRVILARCFPLKVEKLKAATISHWLDELTTAGAVTLYCDEAQGKAYGYFPNWEKYQRVYGLKSKFPAPPAESRAFPHTPAIPRTAKTPAPVIDDLVFAQKFWPIYPARNGKKLEMDEARRRFLKLTPEDQALCCQAVVNYAASQPVKDGVGIRDPKRFLQDGKGKEFWREWLTPETLTTAGKVVTCQNRTQQGQFLKLCKQSVAGPDVNPDRKPYCVTCLDTMKMVQERVREAK